MKNENENDAILTETSPRDSCFAQWSSSDGSRGRGRGEGNKINERHVQ